MFKVEFSAYAEKQFLKLPPDIRERMINVFERIKFNPHHFTKRKEGTNYFIMRVGEYRAILDIDNKKNIMYVMEVGNRKNIYDR